MGWFSGDSLGERQAKANQDTARLHAQLEREAADYQASLQRDAANRSARYEAVSFAGNALYDMHRDWVVRNQAHKQAVYEHERDQAFRENRTPMFVSPEQVPDLELPGPLRGLVNMKQKIVEMPKEPFVTAGKVALIVAGSIVLGVIILGVVLMVAVSQWAGHSTGGNYYGDPSPVSAGGIGQFLMFIAFAVGVWHVGLSVYMHGDPDRTARLAPRLPLPVAKRIIAKVRGGGDDRYPGGPGPHA